MKILFITHFFSPHIGGVEKHVLEVVKRLRVKGKSVTILTEKYDKKLKDEELINGIRVIRFAIPHIKLLGLVYVWFWLLFHRDLLTRSDIVHIHDVFVWYLPFCFLFTTKKVFTTIHGLEWDNPLSKISILQKRIAARVSTKTIGVGKFLEKYLQIKFDLLTYGAATLIRINVVKKKDTIVYVGRLEENTGLLKFIKWLKVDGKGFKVDFVGDGNLRKVCQKYGRVHGFIDPSPFYKKAEYCVPGGYLSALEALEYNCKLKLFWNNKVKEDYWQMSPFMSKNVSVWAKSQTWDKLANDYISLYNSTK